MGYRASIGIWFSGILEYLRSEVNLRMEPYNIDSLGCAIMHDMFLYGDGMTGVELTRLLSYDKAAISRSADSLEQEGYIVRERDKDDARKQRFYFTEKGREMEARILSVYDEVSELMTQGISEKKVKSCLDTLSAIHENTSKLREQQRDRRTSPPAEDN